jgi:hypothetical protein
MPPTGCVRVLVIAAILLAPAAGAHHSYATFDGLCSDNDRSIDSATGAQRFDLTPPADLPPPPPR